MAELTLVKKQLLDLQATEKLLQDQINMYSEKYGEFQTSLKRSQQVFTGYKSDMEKMSKRTNKMEKEILVWKTKFEKTNVVALELASEKQFRDQFIAKTTRQLAQMQKLCRTLQAERTIFLATFKDNGIEPPQVPASAIVDEVEVEDNTEKGPDKLDIMTKNCAELKSNLAKLQNQLADLQSTDPATPAANGEAKKANKHKNKKGKGKETVIEEAEQPTEVPELAEEVSSQEVTPCEPEIVEEIITPAPEPESTVTVTSEAISSTETAVEAVEK
jgi:Myosin-like coiled-coil protein